MTRLKIRAVALTTLALAACTEEPLDLTGAGAGARATSDVAEAGGGSGSDAAPAGGSPRPTGDAQVWNDDAGRRFVVQVDDEALRSIVLPVLDNRCAGPICHSGRPLPADDDLDLYLPSAGQGPERFATNKAEILEFINFGNPESSSLLTYPRSQEGGQPDHPVAGPPTMAVGTRDYEAILAFIRGSVVEVFEGADGGADGGLDMGRTVGGDGMNVPDPPGVNRVPCAALPPPDRTPYDFQRFTGEVNPMLISTCADGRCHGTAASGGNLWLIDSESDCDHRWNFLTIQWFVDPLTPVESLLLQKPLDRNHGGREVFLGVSDPRYGLLKDWIERAWVRP
ncbi:MAG: hypothetical protein EXR76_10115 [Myxococcales bacterium]|nr:hypothetical protein [Myxococcales bacterium]